MLLWYLSIIGIPVGLIYTLRWVFKSISLPSGSKLAFSGTGEQVYGFFLLSLLVSALKRIDPSENEAFRGLSPVSIAVVWSIVLVALQGVVYREIYKWTCNSVTVGSERPVTFTGQAWPYIGWTILSIASLFTIVGWPWVETAFLRWQFRHTESRQHRFRFCGSGWDLLWRSFVGLGASIAIVPIPWVVAWLYRWAVQNIEIQSIAVPPLESRQAVTAA